jgi:gliding motility-associated-like protein
LSAFGFSFELNDHLAILSARYTRLNGGINSVTKSLKLYDKQGLFKRGVRYLHNDQPLDLTVYPLSKNKFLGYFYMPPIKDDSVRYLVALMNNNLQPVWTRWISMKSPSPFYSGIGSFADATTDDEGNIYLMGTTIGYMEKPRITIHKLTNDGKGVWTSSVAVDETNLLGARIQAVGNHLVVVSEGGQSGSISLRVNKNTGDPVNAFLFNNSGAGILYRRSFDWVGNRFIYAGNDKDEDFIMASFDSTGWPLKIRKIEKSGSFRSGLATMGHLYATFFYYNGSEAKDVILKADSNLNLIFANEYERERDRYPVGLHVQDNSEIIVPGNFFYGGVNGKYLDPYMMKFDALGNLGTCANIKMQNTLSDVDPKVEAIPAIRVPQLISTYPGIDITMAEDNYGERVADILCKSTQKCNSIDLKGKDTICDLSETFIYETVLNNECTLNPVWNYDTSMVKLLKNQDHSIELQFKKPGKTLIKSTINTGCKLLLDSIVVEIFNTSSSLTIGADTTLCPGDSIQLHAGAGFSAYQWNTGATDSTIWVAAAGKYFVTVDNACGIPLSDTIEIFMPAVPLLSAGKDASVCIGEKFERLASPGFTTYHWKNISNQQIVSNTRLLSVTAVGNTRFALMASTAIGCARYDTLGLQVMVARPFDLGSNQSICAGDTAIFSAPNYYAAYNWNTGANTSSIQAWQPGKYSLTVTDTNGCRTSDSASIAAVWALPQPNLGTDKTVCTGSSVLLNPGNFSRYQWQDGSTQSAFNASANGAYFVQVWDANNCSSRDTMRITAQLPLPASFLQATDSLCQYEKLTLAPNTVFKTYLWSTGSNQPSISVDKPGNYILSVTTNNDCAGADTILVIQKSCMEGVYIPNAFTPGNNGLNDVFRPLIFGVVIRYEFSVYNRFGERMFLANETMKGWDGTWKGIAMPANTYVWMCRYQLEGGEAKVEKGMVTLVR